MPPDLPRGTVTFLFTDVEGSTKLLHRLGDEAYAETLGDHRRLLRDAFAAHDGVEIDTQGDAFFVAFPTAAGALDAAREGLHALAATEITVRIGVHTGTPVVTEEGYVGEDVHRAARIAASGHGGQVLVSASAAALVDADAFELRDLGEHRFKDLARPERVYQLGGREFPPIRSLSPSNLPVPATPFLGREEELARVGELLGEPATRILTLTGPGGTGKTRLAIEAAAEASEAFPGGLWWVALAPITDAALVASELATALGADAPEDASIADVLATRSGGRRTLVVLDNAEHLLPDLADEVAPLTRNGAGATLLVTSRERLRLEAEREFAVPSMSAGDATAFLISRAEASGVRLDPSPTVARLADRLDRLPLAMQLAVARLRLFTADQLLERLSSALDLPGERDVDPRQRTLRATIEWSHDLLDEDERMLLRRLSVFAAGGTVEAVEAICETDADVLLSLVDKSLVRRRDDAPEPRFWMLETIRGFAAERLADARETERFRDAHARWYAAFATRSDDELRVASDRAPLGRAMDAELDDVRSALAWSRSRDAETFQRLAAGFSLYANMRSLYREWSSWLGEADELPWQDPKTRLRVLDGVSALAYRRGDHELALRASAEALPLAAEHGDDTDLIVATTNHGDALSGLGRIDEAIARFDEAIVIARRLGTPTRIASALVNRGDLSSIAGRYEEAVASLSEALAYAREHDIPGAEVVAVVDLGTASLMLDRLDDAERYAREAAHSTVTSDTEAIGLLLLAGVALRRGDLVRGARLFGASEAHIAATGYEFEPAEQAAVRLVLDELESALADPAVRSAYEQGRALDQETAASLIDEPAD